MMGSWTRVATGRERSGFIWNILRSELIELGDWLQAGLDDYSAEWILEFCYELVNEIEELFTKMGTEE